MFNYKNFLLEAEFLKQICYREKFYKPLYIILETIEVLKDDYKSCCKQTICFVSLILAHFSILLYSYLLFPVWMTS